MRARSTRPALRLAAWICLAGFAPVAGLAQDAAAPGLQRNLGFTDYPALASGPELAHRLLGPEAYRAADGAAQPPQVLDLGREQFAVYVPKRRPAAGYGLMVFVPPWRDAALPAGWRRALDAHGVIFVTAARSGNEESVNARRAPLALIAAWNVRRRYPVDPSRIYVGGFSGGSRVAERLLLAYPDVFTGALLNAGADPLGRPETPIPPAPRLAQVQTSARVVLVTGERDEAAVAMDAAARTSMRSWCLSHVDQITIRGAGHAPATPETLDDALAALERTDDDRREATRSASCRERLAARVAAERAAVEALRAQGASAESLAAAEARLETRYGWLAQAP